MSWHTVALDEVATIERSGVDPMSLDEETPYVGLEHIEAGGRLLEIKPVSNGELKSTKFAFGPDHILYGKLRPYLAKIALPGFEGICSTDILPILPGRRIDRNYLCHFLRQPAMIKYATSRAEGVNLPRLSPKALAKFEIPLPPLDEQKRIAATLDKADQLRQKRRQAIALLDSLTQSIFLEMFGDLRKNDMNWQIQSLDDLCKRITVGIVVKPASYYADEGVIAIRSQNIKAEGFDLNDVVYFSDHDNENLLSKTRIFEGDVVVVRTGQPGKAAVVDGRLHGSNAIDVLIVSPDSNKLDPQFLSTFINSPIGKQIVLSEQRGQIQQHLNVGALKKTFLPLPPLAKQQRFTCVWKKLKSIILTSDQNLNSSNSLFSSLQHRAFSGQL